MSRKRQRHRKLDKLTKRYGADACLQDGRLHLKAKGDDGGEVLQPMRLSRIDRGGLGAPIMREDGSVIIDAYLCRTGIQEYREPDGTIVRELRPREEVLSKDHFDSMAQRAVTIGHPGDLVTPESAGDVMHGTTGQAFEVDSIDGNDWVRGQIALLTDDAIDAVTNGDAQETSQGYTCFLDFTPGRFNGTDFGPHVKDGQPYDAIQRNLVANHTAILPAGRAWVDAAQSIMRLDGNRAVVCNDQDPPHPGRPQPTPATPQGTQRADGDTDMEKRPVTLYRLDAEGGLQSYVKDMEVSAESAGMIGELVQMLLGMLTKSTGEYSKMEGEFGEMKGELDAAKATIDAATADATKAKTDHATALTAAASPEARKARRDLEAVAKGALAEGVNMDALSDDELAKAVTSAVIADAYPGVDLEGKEPAYVKAMFDMALKAKGDGDDDGDGSVSVLDGLESEADDGATRQGRSDAITGSAALGSFLAGRQG